MEMKCKHTVTLCCDDGSVRLSFPFETAEISTFL
jgi:hypothetical protein